MLETSSLMEPEMLEERHPGREGAGMVTIWVRAEMFFVGVEVMARPAVVAPVGPAVVSLTGWLMVGSR